MFGARSPIQAPIDPRISTSENDALSEHLRQVRGNRVVAVGGRHRVFVNGQHGTAPEQSPIVRPQAADTLSGFTSAPLEGTSPKSKLD